MGSPPSPNYVDPNRGIRQKESQSKRIDEWQEEKRGASDELNDIQEWYPSKWLQILIELPFHLVSSEVQEEDLMVTDTSGFDNVGMIVSGGITAQQDTG